MLQPEHWLETVQHFELLVAQLPEPELVFGLGLVADLGFAGLDFVDQLVDPVVDQTVVQPADLVGLDPEVIGLADRCLGPDPDLDRARRRRIGLSADLK